MKLAPDLICKAAGIQELDKEQLVLAQRFCELVWSANSRINLVSRRCDVKREIERQFLLSVAALDLIQPAKGLKWLDIGSGGGFPGIPLAIFRPDIAFVLVESIAKKAFFLERTVEALGVPNISITQERLAADGPSPKVPHHAFDWVSVKAVAEWEMSLQWGDSFLKPSGCLLTYKPILVRAAESRALERYGFKMLSSTPIIDKTPEAGLHIFVFKKHAIAK